MQLSDWWLWAGELLDGHKHTARLEKHGSRWPSLDELCSPPPISMGCQVGDGSSRLGGNKEDVVCLRATCHTTQQIGNPWQPYRNHAGLYTAKSDHMQKDALLYLAKYISHRTWAKSMVVSFYLVLYWWCRVSSDVRFLISLLLSIHWMPQIRGCLRLWHEVKSPALVSWLIWISSY